ncbi:MAG: nuclear transport factor 2 family protein [Dehalococcoidia bacterium]
MSNIQLVKQYFEALNQATRTRDFNRVLAMFTDDATFYFMGSPKRGKEAIGKFFENFPVGRIKASNLSIERGVVTADIEQQVSDTQRPVKATLTFVIEEDKIKYLSIEPQGKESAF